MKRVRRRDVVRVIPLLFVGSALAALGRAVTACTSGSDDLLPRKPGPATGSPTPTDDDEFVPPNGNPPVSAGDLPPTVPSQAWESRVKQLEDDQLRLFGTAIFTRAVPGIWAGKENSHEPVATTGVAGKYKKVRVLVQHVMGANGLDAGAPDAAKEGGGGGGDGGGDGGGRQDGGDGGDAGDAGAADASVDSGIKPPVHYITTIFLRALVNGTDTVVGLWEFKSTDAAPPSVIFTLPDGVTNVTAYEWCTLHGLWKAAPLPV